MIPGDSVSASNATKSSMLNYGRYANIWIFSYQWDDKKYVISLETTPPPLKNVGLPLTLGGITWLLTLRSVWGTLWIAFTCRILSPPTNTTTLKCIRIGKILPRRIIQSFPAEVMYTRANNTVRNDKKQVNITKYRKRCNCAEGGNGMNDLLPTFLNKLRAGTAQSVQSLKCGMDIKGALVWYRAGHEHEVSLFSKTSIPALRST